MTARPTTAADTVDAEVVAVIVNYRTAALVEQCLAGLDGQRRQVPRLTVLIVDGGSNDGSAVHLGTVAARAAYARWVTFVALDFNGGFGWANNEALRILAARGLDPQYIYFVNPDAVPMSGAVALLLSFLERTPAVAVAGSMILDGYGRAAGCHFAFPTLGSELARGLNAPRLAALLGLDHQRARVDEPLRCDWVSGASFVIRTAALRQCGGFDEGFFLYFEEVELMARLAQHGWQTWHVPASRVSHPGGAATGVADGASAAQRLPAYWHVSRWRFLTLHRSSRFAVIASLSWALGRALSAVRTAFGGGRGFMQAPREARDMVHMIVHDRCVQPPAIGRIDTAPGGRPAWTMRR